MRLKLYKPFYILAFIFYSQYIQSRHEKHDAFAYMSMVGIAWLISKEVKEIVKGWFFILNTPSPEGG